MQRLCTSDGTFDRLVTQWSDECASFEEDLAGYATPHLEHARKICDEHPQDRRYGIFAVEGDGRFDCLMHVNLARLPGTTGNTLRLVWVLLAPRFDFGDRDEDALALVVTNILHGAITTARHLSADEIKLQLTGFGDHAYFRGVAHGFAADGGLKLVVKGNWLHISNFT